YLKHPWQLCLALTGIALGVAVYVGVDLANDSARRAFELSAELVTGRTTHHLMGTDGTVPDDTYRELRVRHGPLLAAPVIEDEVRLAHRPSRELTVIGIDPLEETAFRGFSGLVPGRAADLTRLIVEPGTVLVPAALAELGGQRRVRSADRLQPGSPGGGDARHGADRGHGRRVFAHHRRRDGTARDRHRHSPGAVRQTFALAGRFDPHRGRGAAA
ncbi:MAG: ABC transporter permease, partial [Rhodospirillaceae bacterium]|nr:ABC transporter permease [Rhodospirillaceae bacterium]